MKGEVSIGLGLGVKALCLASVHDCSINAPACLPAPTMPRVEGVKTLPLKGQRDKSWVCVK